MSLLKLSTCLTAKAEHQGPPGDARALPYHKSTDPWHAKYQNHSSKGQAGIQNFTKARSDVATKSQVSLHGKKFVQDKNWTKPTK